MLLLPELYPTLPYKPYCTDDLGTLSIQPKQIAVRKRYIQHNPPCMTHFIGLDIDHPHGAMRWAEEYLPPPRWTTQNPVNGHAHIVYELEKPVCTSENGSIKALKYLAAIQAGLIRATRADSGYSNFITKNPLHDHWRTEVWTDEKYKLDYLAEFIELRALNTTEKQSGLGRNCTLFDTVRHWAYNVVREHRGKQWEQWYHSVLNQALSVNMAFPEPLPYSEIKATAKSIAKYCWNRDGYHYHEFIHRQAIKGSKGGKASNSSPGGLARSAKYKEQREKALQLKALGVSNKLIAQELQVSDRTVRNWMKRDF
ncbi:replication initiation protein [Psychrobacter celer]|uniref:replication initiation protein n=1 Tax=Psychrobacter celer TaxID=306572 RepID=UPI003FD0490A